MESFNYMLLGRLKADCEYFLGNGNRQEKHLHQLSVKAQIALMKELWENFLVKPSFLTWEDILEYERRMENE